MTKVYDVIIIGGGHNALVCANVLAKKNKKVKLIVNARNFGADASIMHGIAQVQTDACIYIVSDLQDPPELIPDLIKKWEEGFKIVGLVKTESEESKFIFFLRKLYYRLLIRISETPPIKNYAGSGLIDREVIKILKDDCSKKIEILAIISGRSWQLLENSQICKLFVERLAENDAGYSGFSQVLADALFMPGLRKHIMKALGSPKCSDNLSKRADEMFGQVRT